MVDRRTFLSGLSALGLAALIPSPAAANTAAGFVTTARDKLTGRFLVARIDANLDIVWEAALPGRAHGIGFSPDGKTALVASRRPGPFLNAFDIEDGYTLAKIAPAKGRHFYGHAVFGRDGRTVYATENAYDIGTGVIGVYDSGDGYKRIGEFPAGGVGPHQLDLMADGRTLAVGNGGILTHPDSGRKKLNLDVMRSSLSLLDADKGTVIHHARVHGEDNRLLSLRHLAVDGDRVVAVAQDQAEDFGRTPVVKPLAFVFDRNGSGDLRPLPASGRASAAFNGYCGSAAVDRATGTVAVTSPRGNVVALWRKDGNGYAWLGDVSLNDVCGAGAAPGGPGCVVTSGAGAIRRLDGQGQTVAEKTYDFRQWDNHLTTLA